MSAPDHGISRQAEQPHLLSFRQVVAHHVTRLAVQMRPYVASHVSHSANIS
jgi:hypothetical protein